MGGFLLFFLCGFFWCILPENQCDHLIMQEGNRRKTNKEIECQCQHKGRGSVVSTIIVIVSFVPAISFFLLSLMIRSRRTIPLCSSARKHGAREKVPWYPSKTACKAFPFCNLKERINQCMSLHQSVCFIEVVKIVSVPSSQSGHPFPSPI